MDVLSEVLRAIRLNGAVFFNLEVRAPWVANTPAGALIHSKVMPEAEHVIMFHVVTEGAFWAELVDGSVPPLRIEAGGILVVPMADNHVICSSPGMRAAEDLRPYYRPTDQQLPFIVGLGQGEGERSRIICGYIGCDLRPFNPILPGLPRLLHIPAPAEGSALSPLLQVAVDETSGMRSGGEVVLSKIAELMFVDVVRRYLEALPPEASGLAFWPA